MLPATVASAARRPSDTPRLTVNTTLGPGTKISTYTVTRNAARWLVGTINSQLLIFETTSAVIDRQASGGRTER
jgi:hypothetical protein